MLYRYELRHGKTGDYLHDSHTDCDLSLAEALGRLNHLDRYGSRAPAEILKSLSSNIDSGLRRILDSLEVNKKVLLEVISAEVPASEFKRCWECPDRRQCAADSPATKEVSRCSGEGLAKGSVIHTGAVVDGPPPTWCPRRRA